MRLFVEGCNYDKGLLEKVLGKDIADDAVDGNGKFRYVGYLWNDEKSEAVFFLPKIIVYNPDEEKVDEVGDVKHNVNNTDAKTKRNVFGLIAPNVLAEKDLKDIVLDKMAPDDWKRMVNFLLDFAIWIYRALSVFKKANTDNSVDLKASSNHSPSGTKHICETRLDVILALLEFYRRNRDFVIFTAKRCHSGFNKVNWTKTVAKRTPFFQSDDEPVYMQVENRKKRVNYEEELLVIFHSILHYLAESWGFPLKFDLNYEPISGAQFKRYLDGYGAARLRAIKYRYFSDKLLELWELCYLFFEKMRSARPTSTPSEYLYAKKFDVVFEAMIDELIGDSLDGELAGLRKLKEQADGKRADHIFFDSNLYGHLAGRTDPLRQICYIGDSKYYGIGNDVRVNSESEYKQFTYARNVIHWNIDYYFKNPVKPIKVFPPLRDDDVTEGYDTIPNFFISANLLKDDKFSFDKGGFNPRGEIKHSSRQFKNRLFDRDTLHIAHFDVNFLYVIALYGRNNAAAKAAWKTKVHGVIREEILKILKERYAFFKLELCDGMTDEHAKTFINANFKKLNGKVFSFLDLKDKRIYLLALEKTSACAKACLEDFISSSEISSSGNPFKSVPIEL